MDMKNDTLLERPTDWAGERVSVTHKFGDLLYCTKLIENLDETRPRIIRHDLRLTF